MRFYKKNAALRWHASLDFMTRVEAIAIRTTSRDGHFYGCGQNNSYDRAIEAVNKERDSEAWFFSMDVDGEI